MGRKNKANSDESSDAAAAKKIKVSDDNEAGAVVEQEEDLGPWEGTRVIPAEANVICRLEECKAPATATWTSQQTGDAWDMCDACQLRDFGECYRKGVTTDVPPQGQEAATKDEGEVKPDMDCDKDPLQTPTRAGAGAVTAELDHHGSAQPTQVPQDPVLHSETPPSEAAEGSPGVSALAASEVSAQEPQKQQSNVVSEDGSTESDEDGQYDLKKIIPFDELSKQDNMCCSKEECGGLPAFGLYVNSSDERDRWYYCLDCQEDDFGGWPPINDLPVPYLEPKHLQLMLSKCSRRVNVAMPVFPSESPKGKIENSKSNVVTPPPNSLDANGKPATAAPGPDKKAKIPARNSKAIELHTKWREAAQMMGGKDARIVVGLPAAKKIIFDFLYEEFRPMNITQIYQGLKAVVPQPVLNTCLQQMIPDQLAGKNPFDSDDDDEEAQSKAQKKEMEADPYAQSLLFKAGKNLSNNLYYVDYTKTKGHDPSEREALNQSIATSKAENQELNATLNAIKDSTRKLLAQPTNEELLVKLQEEERVHLEITAALEDGQKLKVNEKHKKVLKRRIERMAVHWRLRRKLVLDFLTSLEENSDGVITRRKCLKGDGPIDIDSDEAVANTAVEFSKKKRSRPQKLLKRGANSGTKSSTRGVGKAAEKGSLAEDFHSNIVAVLLDKQLKIVRVHSDADE